MSQELDTRKNEYRSIQNLPFVPASTDPPMHTSRHAYMPIILSDAGVSRASDTLVVDDEFAVTIEALLQEGKSAAAPEPSSERGCVELPDKLIKSHLHVRSV